MSTKQVQLAQAEAQLNGPAAMNTMTTSECDNVRDQNFQKMKTLRRLIRTIGLGSVNAKTEMVGVNRG